jgi:NAD(P)-dependent dehydrogenase (short-subunit alcohol dehydrogenase family)
MLKNRTVFISGGTGYIGSELCRKLHQNGAKVIFSYQQNIEKAKTLAEELPGSVFVQIDLRSVSDINQQIEKILTEHGKIDILVNNASVTQAMPLAMLEEEDADFVFDINLKGTLFLTRAVVRGMIKDKSGVIVNMGSIAGHRLLDVPVTYAMSKAAFTGLTYSLAVELKKFNIRVNNVVPGMLDGGVASEVPEEFREDFIKHCASNRVGSAADVAEVVCFLASDKSAYMNGQNVFVDGGI